MTISMYQASVPVFRRGLGALGAILDKTAAHCVEQKIEESALLRARLFPDMFDFTKQVQVAADFAKGGAARLAGLEPPKYDDNEASFAELKARVERTVAYLGTFTAAQIDGSEQRRISYQLGRFPIDMQGLPYLLDFVLPNFYFHYTTAYDLLRHNGVPLGKRDYMGAA